MNEKNGIEYLETIKYIAKEYALKIDFASFPN